MRVGTAMACAAVLCSFGLAAPGAGAARGEEAAASLGRVGERARDCVGEAFLDRSERRAIRFVVWCGTQRGIARFRLRRREGGFTGFPRRIEPTGAGAERGFRCHRRGRTLKCRGRKRGPVVVRGAITVPAGTRCAAPTRLETAGVYSVGKPAGCPGVRRRRGPGSAADLAYMRGFRRDFGLDLDLRGDKAAIDRRIRGLIRAWRRGDPVARYAYVNVGQPLRARDLRELDYREEYLEQTAVALERWVPGHAAATYAGYELDHQGGGTFYVGFVGDQEAQLAAFLRSFEPIAPQRIKPFPVPPTHSERQLIALEEEILDWWQSHDAAITTLGLDIPANKVEVGSERVAETRRLLAERFGPEAPIEVVYARIEALAGGPFP